MNSAAKVPELITEMHLISELRTLSDLSPRGRFSLFRPFFPFSLNEHSPFLPLPIFLLFFAYLAIDRPSFYLPLFHSASFEPLSSFFILFIPNPFSSPNLAFSTYPHLPRFKCFLLSHLASLFFSFSFTYSLVFRCNYASTHL